MGLKSKILLPYRRYVETLIVGRKSEQAILDEILKHNLPAPEPTRLIRDIFSEMKMLHPDFFLEENFKQQPDPDWLEELGIINCYAYLFNADYSGEKGMKGAFSILNDPKLYRTLTALAMAGITSEDIELIVNSKYDISYEPEDFESFLNYFFDITRWSLVEKEKYIKNKKLSQKDKIAYRMALSGDKPYLLWKLGYSPGKSFDDMLKEMIDDSFYHFKEMSKEDPELALKWGQMVDKLGARLSKIDEETEEKTDQFTEMQFKIKSKDTMKEIPHIQEVGADIPSLDDVMSEAQSELLEKVKTRGNDF